MIYTLSQIVINDIFEREEDSNTIFQTQYFEFYQKEDFSIEKRPNRLYSKYKMIIDCFNILYRHLWGIHMTRESSVLFSLKSSVNEC